MNTIKNSMVISIIVLLPFFGFGILLFSNIFLNNGFIVTSVVDIVKLKIIISVVHSILLLSVSVITKSLIILLFNKFYSSFVAKATRYLRFLNLFISLNGGYNNLTTFFNFFDYKLKTFYKEFDTITIRGRYIVKYQNKKKISQENIVNRELKYGSIVSIATFILGFLLIMFGIEEVIDIALLGSWVIFIIKMAIASLFKDSLYKIINTIYWIFFVIIIIGFFTFIFNITLDKDKFEYNKIRIKNDNIGFVTNANIEINGDTSTIKLVKPNIFRSNNNVDSDVVYKKDNGTIMYLLYDCNIGLHIIYVGYSYLYIYSIVLFFIIIGLSLIDIFKTIILRKKG